MKIKLLSAILLSSIGIASAQTVVTIGTGTSSGTSSPIATFYNSSATESIYTSDEVGLRGTITNLAFNKASGSSSVEPFVQIYLKSTSQSALSERYTIGGGFADYVLVYEGNLPNNDTAGWMELALQNSYNFTGQNLSLLVIGSTCIEQGRPQFRFTTTSGNKMCAGYTDGRIGCDGDNPWTQDATMAPIWERPNIKLTFGTLATQTFSKDNGIAVFPSKGNIKITSATTNLNVVEVYDLQGRQLFMSKNISANEFNIATLPQTGSVLLVKVADNEGRLTSKKIVY